LNQHIYQRRPVSNSAIPTVIFGLLVANGLVFAAQQMQPNMMAYYFALWPLGSPRPEFQVWQLLSYGFMHGGLNHIFFNMFGLWMFGRDIENVLGSKRFLIYYVAGLCHVFPQSDSDAVVPAHSNEGQVLCAWLWTA